jgi:tripartite-type tricarboxylate transporter receptor subunit TctC
MSVSYDILSDFTHIGMIFEGPPLILIVNPSLPYKSVKDLVDDARANPGKISFGSSGPASGPSLAIAQFQSMANINVVDVPYRGVVQAALGVASGEISSAFTFQNSAKPLADDGKVRALASTGAARSSSWPGLPTMNESGFPGYEFEAFVGIAAPAKTPPNIINELSQNLNATVSDPSIQALFANLGMRPREKNSPADIATYMKREVARIGELAKLTKK